MRTEAHTHLYKHSNCRTLKHSLTVVVRSTTGYTQYYTSTFTVAVAINLLSWCHLLFGVELMKVYMYKTLLSVVLS